MVRLPKLPNPPAPGDMFSLIDKASNAIETGLNIIDKIGDKFDQAAQKFGPPDTSTTRAPETQKEPSLRQNETTGTACLPCSRDHLLTASSSLSEAIRFAREKGVRDREVGRRIRIALQELDVMERIDLAPEEIIKLKGAEKELATWTLKQSRELRHAITDIKDVEAMELAAGRASVATDEFMARLWSIPEEECETCGEVRESIRQFIEKRKRARGE